MTKTIVLTDLIIDKIHLNYHNNTVTVMYSIVDNAATIWETGEATFWATMPPQNPIYSGSTIIGYEDYPATWFQLPASYIPTLVGLRDDADAALTARFLV